MDQPKKLLRHARVTGRIVCLTNTRIGGSKESFEIGGQDNPVIRHPLTREPYLPGSSLKGKMRSLLELDKSVDARPTERPCGCGNCIVCDLFGRNVWEKDKEAETQPTRLLFRDAHLSEKDRQEVAGESFIKFETAINRKTGTVQQGSLRNQEFVPAGTQFDFEISVRIFERDEPALFKSTIEKAVALLEKDYLGGSGSRGYGKVKFEDLRFEGFSCTGTASASSSDPAR